jgi:signal transduction histidine kinase
MAVFVLLVSPVGNGYAADQTPSIDLAPIEIESEEFPATGLTESDREWLEDHPQIRHGIVRDSPPFEYVDEHGEYRGLTSDYVAIIADKLRLKFRRIIYRNADELYQGMLAGEVDFSTYLYIDSDKQETMRFDQSPISVPVVMLGRREMGVVPSLIVVGNKTLAVERGSRMQFLLQRDFPEIDLRFVNNTIEGLRAVDRGEADLFIHNVLSADYYQRRYDIHDLKVVATTLYEYKLSFGVRQEYEPLLGIIHKVLLDLSDREKNLIFDKWANIQIEHELDWKTISIWGGGVLLVILAITATMLYWNHRLTQEVAHRTHELEQSSRTLRNLARHMDKVREEEKAFLAREIHDELGHTLTALNLGIRRLSRKLTDGVSVSSKVLEELRSLVTDATRTSRRIMSDLRPGVLEDLGLIAAIEWLVQEFQNHSGIICTVKAAELPVKLDNDAAISLFRITQEALTNAAKHAEASTVTVEVGYQGKWLALKISDDGKGMQIASSNGENSMGLQSMNERALAIGGKLELESTVGDGLRVIVRAPVL